VTSSADLPIIVIGGGAAGAVAAAFAAGQGARVLVLERTKDGGRKILISGGGRCNVLPSRMTPSQYITASSPNTLKKMLLSWPLDEQREFFEQTLGIPLALETESGKLFPVSNRARDVRDALFGYAMQRGAEFRFDTPVGDLTRGHGEPWRVHLEDGVTLAASCVVVATGGLSVPATGSDGTGLRFVKRLGHTIHETYPALTPLTAQPPVHADLAGISLEVVLRASLAKSTFSTQGGFLFTHRGYSGPSVLDISHLAVRSRTGRGPTQEILVQWTSLDVEGWDLLLRTSTSGALAPLLRKHLPARLAERLIEEASVHGERPLAELRRAERKQLVSVLARYPLPWTGDEGYKKAEVTGGGVSLAEVDPRTMESRLHPRLFLCGEILDAFGPIGGYNFLWGWATGRAAGRGAAQVARDAGQ
jgi:predicted Rossmann fold flavoprotein